MIFALVLVAIAVLSEAAEVSVSETPKRSARWDDHIESLKRAADPNRVKRSGDTPVPATTPCGWQHDKAVCSRMDFTVADQLNRRANNGPLAAPQNQGSCGSCWAFATVNALTDQLSINAGRKLPLLSSRYLTTCNKDRSLVGNGNGCCGAKLHAGVEFIKENGIVENTCSTYGDLVSFSRSVKNTRGLPNCPVTCHDRSSVNPSTRSLRGHMTLTSDDDIITALNEGSVVIAGMLISDEFKGVYQCGIYCESEASKAMRAKQAKQRGHAVIIVDYGTQSGINFWVIKNSWGGSRHENGYFRIRRGELNIGRNNWALKLVFDEIQSETSRNTPVTFRTCTVDTISDPEDYESIMSAIDFVLEELINEGVVAPCSDGTTVSQLTLDSIANSSLQDVSGTSIGVSLIANTPCREGNKHVKARIDATVFINLNGTFVLRNDVNYSTFLVSSSKGRVGNIWLVAFLNILLGIVVVAGYV